MVVVWWCWACVVVNDIIFGVVFDVFAVEWDINNTQLHSRNKCEQEQKYTTRIHFLPVVSLSGYQ